MDPNAALEAIRTEARKILAAVDAGDDVPEAAQRLAEHAEALDEWLGRGGFLPSAWER